MNVLKRFRVHKFRRCIQSSKSEWNFKNDAKNAQYFEPFKIDTQKEKKKKMDTKFTLVICLWMK